MPYIIEADEAGTAWIELLETIIDKGRETEPRGLECREIFDVKWHVRRAWKNLIVHPERRLAYRFAVAEWLWIWYGLEDVKTISRYNPNIGQYSDDGKIFAGAYGPRIKAQWSYVVEKLRQDRESRQAIITIFSPAPAWSKDIPCTLSVQFLIRQMRLYTIVTMRSSDAWLGIVYDVFNFSMIANILARTLNVSLGSITFNLGSSHLYTVGIDMAGRVLRRRNDVETLRSPMLKTEPPEGLLRVLKTGRIIHIDEPMWNLYAEMLRAPTNREALEVYRRRIGVC